MSITECSSICLPYIICLSLKQLHERYFMHEKSLMNNSGRPLAIWKQGQAKLVSSYCGKDQGMIYKYVSLRWVPDEERETQNIEVDKWTLISLEKYLKINK